MKKPQRPRAHPANDVHDELILEADPSVTVEEIAAKMALCPPWAKGLLLRADGYTCTTYRKE